MAGQGGCQPGKERHFYDIKRFDVLTRVGLFVSRILRAFEEEISELRPFFTSAFKAFLSGAEYFLASSMSLKSIKVD